MNDCKFCNIENKKENTIIYESSYFYVIPSLGAFIPNYLLLISKKHIYSMSELENVEFEEYKKIVNKFTKNYEGKFNRKLIMFEHGSSSKEEHSASSVTHAHLHIIDYNFKDEQKLINDLKMQEIKIEELKNITKNYVFYISNNGKCYITLDFPSVSQLMRIKIAEEIGMKDKYNWKKDKFMKNINLTIENFKKIK